MNASKTLVPFGKYVLLERISVGGMAEVFKAQLLDGQPSEPVLALKRILPSIAEDADFIAMFVDEARIAGQLHHPNIAEIFELGEVDGAHFIAMEFVWGKDLLQIQNRFRKLRAKMPAPMAAACAEKICVALDYAHKKIGADGQPLGIIHRDVSPQNVLVGYAGEVKVIDFGIAKAAARSTKTQAGVLKGKFSYMSPEQVGGRNIDHRSDIFAISTVLYELLLSDRLFHAESDYATLEKVRNVEVPRPSEVLPGLPGELERILLKGLTREPDDRYQSAAEMQVDLRAFLDSLPQEFGEKDLSAWMHAQFAAERKREEQSITEELRILDALRQSRRSGELPAMTAEPEPPGLDELPADKTQISEMPFPVPAPESTLSDGGVTAAMASIITADGYVISAEEGHTAGPEASTLSGETSTPDAPDLAGMAALMAPHVAQGVPPEAPPPPEPAAGEEGATDRELPQIIRARSTLGRDLLMGTVLGLLVLGGVAGVRAAQRRPVAGGTLVVTVMPPSRSTVLLDGVERGRIVDARALTLRDVAIGDHRIEVRGDSGQFAQPVIVAEGDVTVVNATLRLSRAAAAAAAAAAAKAAEAANAARDGGAAAVAGVAGDGGAAMAAAAKADGGAGAGAETGVKVAAAAPSEARPSAVEEKPHHDGKVHLMVHSSPAGAEVRVNGKHVGDTPVDVVDPTPGGDGLVRVTVRKSGFPPQTKYLSFAHSRDQTLDLQLDPTGGHASSRQAAATPGESGPHPVAAAVAVAGEPGFLVANSQPWARVYIDEKDTGRSTPIPPRSKLPLKAGKHVVTFSVNGKKWSFDVDIKPGEDTKLIKSLGP